MVQAEVSYCSLTRVAFGRGRSFGGPLFCCFFLFISLLPGGLALRLFIFENQVFRGDLTLPIFLEHICDKPLGISINKRKREYYLLSKFLPPRPTASVISLNIIPLPIPSIPAMKVTGMATTKENKLTTQSLIIMANCLTDSITPQL